MSETGQGKLLRKTSLTGDSVGVGRIYDSIAGEYLFIEQANVAPGAWVKVIHQANNAAAGDYPSKGAVTITGGATDKVTYSGALPAGSPIGLLHWMTQPDGNENELRQIVQLDTSQTYYVNRVWVETPANNDTYRLLVNTRRHNALMIKSEFSATANSALIKVSFFSPNYDPSFPVDGTTAPTKRAPYRSPILRTYELSQATELAQGVDTVETNYYHGNMFAIPCAGTVGAIIQLVSVTGGGNVSLWVAPSAQPA